VADRIHPALTTAAENKIQNLTKLCIIAGKSGSQYLNCRPTEQAFAAPQPQSWRSYSPVQFASTANRK
jgi:hypothetical protein